jgi:phosphoribosylamine--glycine ligase
MDFPINALVLGSGAREHALAWKIAQSNLIKEVFLAPGNGGTETEFTNIKVNLADFESIARIITELQTQLVVIGPEQPLVDGLVDFLKKQGDSFIQAVHIIGPDRACAALEGSKDFSKQIMLDAGIPTALSRTFFPEDWQELEKYLLPRNPPYVIKADGLAAGKGVAICGTLEEALSFSASILKDDAFGAGKPSLLVEDFLSGIEVSMFLLTDGKNYKLLPEAKDYKRIFDGDVGPNTGGMGSVSPVWFVDEIFTLKVKSKIIDPLFKTLHQKGLDYNGFLFLGLMKMGDEPFVIEFNARLGDPETQTLMTRIDGDLVPALLALKDKKLDQVEVRIKNEAACTIVLAAENYPDLPAKGDEIHLEKSENSKFFFAGTALESGKLKTSGGRVLSVTASAQNLEQAIENAYEGTKKISFRGMQFRKDIGKDVLK